VLFDPWQFPNLNASNHRDIDPNPSNLTYNCLAWSLGINDDWFSSFDGRTWPGNAPQNDAFIMTIVIMYESRGFSLCGNDRSLEHGYDKIALYVKDDLFAHVARQSEDGKWTSKMGEGELIEHDVPENLVEGMFDGRIQGEYGQLWKFMKRERGTSENDRFVFLFPLGRRAYAAEVAKKSTQ
jgi:hypothetical protein